MESENKVVRKKWISRVVVVKTALPYMIPFIKSICIYYVFFDQSQSVGRPLEWFTHVVIKCFPSLALVFFAYCQSKFKSFNGVIYNKRIAIGLLLSSVGDIFMFFADISNYIFIILGILAFMGAHFWYHKAFSMYSKSGMGKCEFFVIVTGSVINYLVVVKHAQLLYLKVLILAYAMAIIKTFLVSLRVVLESKGDWSWNQVSAFVGMLMFSVSDSLLGYHMFLSNSEESFKIVMTTYYMAQFCIAASTFDTERHISNI